MIDDGNLTSDGESEYAYDGENRLIEIQPIAPQAGDFRVKFAYDDMGRRVRKLTHEWIVPEPPSEDSPDWSAEPVEDRRFIYDGWNVVMERTCDDVQSCTETIRAKYAWGLDLAGLNGAGANVAQASSPVSGALHGLSGGVHSALHGAGGIGGLLAMEDWDLMPEWAVEAPAFLYLYDGNGNAGQVVTWFEGSSCEGGPPCGQNPGPPPITLTRGQIAARYEYDPYGGTLLADDPLAMENPFRFSTKYYDTQPATAAAGERGMYYYGRRYYIPRFGRWGNHDPIGEMGGLNLYVFVLNNGVNAVDPIGLQPPTSTPTPYSDPAVAKCGSFTICDRNDIVLPETTKDRNGDSVDNSGTRKKLEDAHLDPDHLIGFEVFFTKYDDCPTCCETIRLVQVVKRSGYPTHVDGQARKFHGKRGDIPWGMGPSGHTNDSESFVDGPIGPGDPSFEVCAICRDKTGKDTNLGCVTFTYNEGEYKAGTGYVGRGVQDDPKAFHLTQKINGQSVKCQRKRAADPSATWKEGIEHWSTH